MKEIKRWFWPVSISLILSLVQSSIICNDYSELPRGKMATKTGYVSAVKDETHWKDFKEETTGCVPVKVWFLTRHGTRYPATSDFDTFLKLPILSEEILYNHLQSRGCLSEEDVFEFKRWVPHYDKRDKGELHTTGYEELFNMGEHWRDLFPDIFEELYDASKIKVEFTIRNRTGQSAYHFLRGMYGDEAVGKIKLPEPYSPNYVLRFYKSCPLWLRDVYRNEKTTYKERNLFKDSDDFQEMIRSVSLRLGYINPLDTDDVLVMYDECRYEAAWFPEAKSIWCKPFTEKDFKILEFYQDLKYYYEDSYGTPMNKEMACETVSDLFTHLKSKVSSDSSLPKGVLYFSHDKAILKLQALLGMFEQDWPLTHRDFHRERVFRSSVVASFAANLGFVLYKCGESHKVGMFFGGNPMPMTAVCPTVLCDWERYEAFLRPISENCDLAKTCQIHDEL